MEGFATWHSEATDSICFAIQAQAVAQVAHDLPLHRLLVMVQCRNWLLRLGLSRLCYGYRGRRSCRVQPGPIKRAGFDMILLVVLRGLLSLVGLSRGLGCSRTRSSLGRARCGRSRRLDVAAGSGFFGADFGSPLLSERVELGVYVGGVHVEGEYPGVIQLASGTNRKAGRFSGAAIMRLGQCRQQAIEYIIHILEVWVDGRCGKAEIGYQPHMPLLSRGTRGFPAT